MEENKFLVEPSGDFSCLLYPDRINPTYLISQEEFDLLMVHQLKWNKIEEEETWSWELIENDPTEEFEHNRILARIEELKQLLADSDYKAIKHSEGLISDEEYEPIKEQRQAWRDEINSYEN